MFKSGWYVVQVLFFLTDEMVEAIKRILNRTFSDVLKNSLPVTAVSCLSQAGVFSKEECKRSGTVAQIPTTIKRNFRRQALK